VVELNSLGLLLSLASALLFLVSVACFVLSLAFYAIAAGSRFAESNESMGRGRWVANFGLSCLVLGALCYSVSLAAPNAALLDEYRTRMCLHAKNPPEFVSLLASLPAFYWLLPGALGLALFLYYMVTGKLWQPVPPLVGLCAAGLLLSIAVLSLPALC
jgi:hypothetical protein